MISNPCSFIRVPRQLQGGQLLKVPGKAPPPDEPAALRERQARIAAATSAARSAFSGVHLGAAIRQWDLVQELELDPNNSTPQLERRKARDLRDELGRVVK